MAAHAPTTKRPTPPATPDRVGWVMRVYRFPRPLTPEEFMDLPPGDYGPGKLELVGGDVVEVPPVGGAHTDVADDLVGALRAYVAGRGGEAFGRVRQETSYRLPPVAPVAQAVGAPVGPVPVRAPDVSVVTAAALRALPGGGVGPGERLPEGYLDCAPAVAAEILSPHDYRNWAPFLDKVRDYLAAGVLLVWVLSPRHDTVTVFDPAGGLAAPAVLRRAAGDALDGGAVLPDFRTPLTALFRPLPGGDGATPTPPA